MVILDLEVPKRNLYAIGDIHGCHEELLALMEKLVKDGLSRDDHVVFLGDYIDRGPDSKKVIDILIEFSQTINCTFLRGNHEGMFLDFLGYQGYEGEYFLTNGGAKTLKDYGLGAIVDLPLHFKVMREQIRKNKADLFPKEHIEFLLATEYGVQTDKYIFIHAGLRNSIALDRQDTYDLLWMRQPFLGSKHPFKKWVIHGHTPVDKVMIHEPYEINLDTSCVFGGALTCIKLNDADVANSTLISVSSGTSFGAIL